MRLVPGFATVVSSIALAATPSLALAASGDELVGNTVDVRFSDGTINTVTFDQGGRATLNGDGRTEYASWLVSGDQLCLQTTASRECWAYTQRFAAGVPMTMSSSCNETSEWTARAVNAIEAPAPVSRMGERG